MTGPHTVPRGVAPGRLDVYLAALLGVSRSAAAVMLKSQRVIVDGVPARASQDIMGGEVIVLSAARELEPITAPEVPIMYEDDDLIVIDKPAGVAVHAGNNQARFGTIADFARSRTTDDDPDRPGIVHRLDRETSGLLVVAKSAASKAQLQQIWKDRAVGKTYLALTVGRVTPEEAVITLPLGRDVARPTRRQVRADGRPATTSYRTLADYPGYSYLEARPETGRTHQLRVHFAALGHAIAGDVVYGPPQRPLGLTRQFLHASSLSFTGPSGQVLNLTSPLPEELNTVLKRLEESV